MQTRLLLLCFCVGSYLLGIAQPPANDNCSGAIPITMLDGTCVTGNDNTLSTEDIGPSSCTVGANENVWFSFVATGVSAEIVINSGLGTPEITIVRFPTTPCNAGNALEIACETGSPLVVDNLLTLGTTYYVMVAFSSNADGLFDICINNPNPAPNDACSSASPINTLDNACINGNNNFPSTDVLIPGCFTGSTYNVWYSFIAVGVSLDVYIPAGGPGVGQLAVVDFATNCTLAGSIVLGCATGTNHIVLDNVLTIGSQYHIVVGFQNSNFNGNGIGAFELCIDNPIPAINDDCNTAIVIPTSVLSDPTTCFTTIAGNPLNNDWPSTDIATFGCWDPGDTYNIWYSFVAQGPDVNIFVDPVFPQDAQIALMQFLATPCQFGGSQLLSCSNGTALDYNDQLVIGNTYYIAIGFEDNAVGDFCMNVFNPVPPPNDDPCDAIPLQSGNCEDGTTIYANPEGYSVPGPCQSAISNTVWYTLTLSDPDNVGFNINVQFDVVTPQTQASIILWGITNCNQPGPILFTHCGTPPTSLLEWGPVDGGVTYYLSISTNETYATDFTVCVLEVPPCFENDICDEAEVIPNVMSDAAFVCVPGCNLFADPEAFNNQCQIGNFPSVWFQVQTDPNAALMNIQVTSQEFDAPTITVFQSISGCTSINQILLTNSNLPCIVGSNGEAEAYGTSVGANQIYYIVVSSLNNVGGEFQICVNTISQASACVTSQSLQITFRSFGGPLTGPFLPGETVGVCMNVNSYTAAGNGCQWFQGLIPVFGNGWDESSFDADGQPLNATVNGNPIGVAGNGLYGPSTWDWFTDSDYHYDNVFYQIGDIDGNGTVDMCNILYDPDCPNFGGITGGCCGPCWGTPLGDILPGGWFAYGINGTCPTPGPPVRVDWGDGNTCGAGMGPWNFCFELNVRDYPDCLEDVSTMNLMLGFFTTADGETGSWTGNASVCALDQPASLTLPMCCSQLAEAAELLDPICSDQQFFYSIDEPDVDFWQWTVAAGSVSGALPGSGGPGHIIIHTLVNNSSDPELVTYTFLGFAGGACPVFQKEVTIEVFPQIQVTLDPLVLCATPTTPYVITPEITGGSGNYEYQWAPNFESTPSITIPNPVHGTTYIVSVTDQVGCFGTAAMTISVYSTFPVDILAPVIEQCIQDGPLQIEATATGGMDPYNFDWTLPNGSSSNPVVTSTVSGQHLVEVTDSEGCIGKDSVILTFNPTPDVSVSAVNGALAICEGESTELAGVASNGTSPYTYEWDTPEGLESGKNIMAFTPGIYTVTVEDAKGCTNSSQIEIEAQPEPTPDLGPDILVCNFDDAVEMTVTEEFDDYSWSIGSAGNGLQTIGVYQGGVYTVTVTNEFGCTGETSVEIALFPQPDLPIPDTSMCPGSSITIDVDDFGGPWDNFLWPDCPSCFNTNVITEPGIYEVYVYDENNCSGYAEFEVVETSNIDPNLQGDNVMCTGETITLTTTTGFQDYQWSANAGGATTSSVNVTTPGTYIVTVEDDLGCTGIDSIEVVSGDSVVVINGPASICANVLAPLDAGAGYASYLWSTTETTQTIMVDDGTYSVTVTNTDGCVSSASITIIETPFVPMITGDTMICQTSETTTLDAGGPYASYLWSANAGSATTQMITTSTPGLYTVTVVDNVGCVGNAAFTVTNHPVPFVAITGLPDFCVGGNTQMTATAGYTYVWNTTETTPVITINTPGTFTVTVTDANGCTNTSSTNVNPPFQENVNIIGAVKFCPGDQATLAVPPGYASVLWSTTETTDQIIVTFEGEVSVIVVDADGCIAYDTVTTVADADLSPVISGDPAICDAGTAVLNAGPGYDNYMWSHGLGTTQIVSVNAPGTYSVTVSSNSGCFGDDDFVVTGYVSPFANVTPTASACDLQEPGGPPTTINFNALITGGDAGGSWVQVSGPSPVNLANLNNVNFSGLLPGSYAFTYTTASATPPCVEQPYPLTVTVTSCACPPVALINAPDLCNDLGSINLNTLVSAQTQNDGVWTVISTPSGSNPGVITGTYVFNASSADPGPYTLQYQLSGLPSYCPDNATVNVNVLRNPVAGIAAPALQYCAGENQSISLATLLIGADGGGMWNESSQNPSTGGAFNPATGTFIITAQAPGKYTFDYVIMGPGPCPDDMTTVEIFIEANPVADAGSTSTIDCLSPTTTLGGSGTSMGPDFSYLWTTADGVLGIPNQPITTATAAGTYVLTVMNTMTGCSATDQVVIDQIGDFPTKINMLVQSPDCEGDPPGSVQVTSIDGGLSPYMYSLNNAPPVSSPVFNNLAAGHYTLAVTDATGCELSDTFSIGTLVEVDLTIVNYVNDILVFPLGDMVKFSFIYSGSSDTPDSLVWKSGTEVLCIGCPVLEFEALFSGTITLEAYDERGCFIKKTVSYLVVRKRDVYLPNIFSPNGDNLNDYFTLFTDADVKEITLMEIYTRWGDLIYRKSNFQPNNPNEGWDGKFNGEDLNPGVYVYRIEILYGDDLKDQLAGDITIVK